MTRLALLLAACLLSATVAGADHPRVRLATNYGVIVLALWPEVAPKTVENFIGLAEGSKEWTTPTGEKVRKPFYDGLIFHEVTQDYKIQAGCPLGNGRGGPGYRLDLEISAEALGLDKEMTIVGSEGWGLNPLAGNFFAAYMNTHLDRKLRSQGEQFSTLTLEQQGQILKRELGEMTVKEFFVVNGVTFVEGLDSKQPLRGRIAMVNDGPHISGSQFFIILADMPEMVGRSTVFGEVVEGMQVVDRIGAAELRPRSERPLRDARIEKVTVSKP